MQEEEARRKGLDVAGLRRGRSGRTWKQGLASWGQDGERIRRLEAAANFRIYTPGSNAGVPISILASFAAPPPELVDDAELFGDRVAIHRDEPPRSRRHRRRPAAQPRAHPDLVAPRPRLARGQRATTWPRSSPTSRSRRSRRSACCRSRASIPAKDRFELAMTLNNLLAAPGFDVWLKGDAARRRSSCSTRRTAGRGSRSSRSRTSRTPSACSSSRCCSTRRSPGCAPSRAPPACGRSSTWTRSSATCRRRRIRRRRSRC